MGIAAFRHSTVRNGAAGQTSISIASCTLVGRWGLAQMPCDDNVRDATSNKNGGHPAAWFLLLTLWVFAHTRHVPLYLRMLARLLLSRGVTFFCSNNTQLKRSAELEKTCWLTYQRQRGVSLVWRFLLCRCTWLYLLHPPDQWAAVDQHASVNWLSVHYHNQ